MDFDFLPDDSWLLLAEGVVADLGEFLASDDEFILETFALLECLPSLDMGVGTGERGGGIVVDGVDLRGDDGDFGEA